MPIVPRSGIIYLSRFKHRAAEEPICATLQKDTMQSRLTHDDTMEQVISRSTSPNMKSIPITSKDIDVGEIARTNRIGNIESISRAVVDEQIAKPMDSI